MTTRQTPPEPMQDVIDSDAVYHRIARIAITQAVMLHAGSNPCDHAKDNVIFTTLMCNTGILNLQRVVETINAHMDGVESISQDGSSADFSPDDIRATAIELLERAMPHTRVAATELRERDRANHILSVLGTKHAMLAATPRSAADDHLYTYLSHLLRI